MRVAIDRCIASHNARLGPEGQPLTQALLAQSLGVSQSTISRWQSGQRSVTLYWAKRLTEVLYCGLEDLISWSEVCHVGIPEYPLEGGEQ